MNNKYLNLDMNRAAGVLEFNWLFNDRVSSETLDKVYSVKTVQKETGLTEYIAFDREGNVLVSFED